MLENKVLKWVSYILTPIILFVLIISLVYQITYTNSSYEDEKTYSEYLESDDFLKYYMSTLSNKVYELIYKNSEYNYITDSGYKIYFDEKENTVENFSYMIIYKDKILTNIELTRETNTFETIKNAIISKNAEKANFNNGNVDSSIEIINSKAILYFDDFQYTYYTKNTNNSTNELIENQNTVVSDKIYHNTTINDFTIYSSYERKNLENKTPSYDQYILNKLSNYENLIVIILPISLVLVSALIGYLIMTVGNSKKEGFCDKIPLELLCGGYILIIFLIFALFSFNNYSSTHSYEFRFITSCIITEYIALYIISTIFLYTIIKKIKNKNLLSSSIIVKIIKLIYKKSKEVLNVVSNNISFSLKLILITIIYVVLSAILIIVFSGFGFIISIIVAIYIFYKIIEQINCFYKIENHLKKIYEGNDYEKLSSYDFTPEFQNTVTYINNISSGFENAIEKGVKSERFKAELITNVSHDIKTPLTSIINYVDLIKKENIDNEKVKEYIEVLDIKSQRLKKLTEDLIEASKASSGNVKLHMEKINIAELIKQSIGEFEDKFNKKNLELDINISNENIFINADNKYMYRIIENLFSNISKYALEYSRVYIDVIKKSSTVQISIKNISREKLNISEEELMQRFVRGDKSRATEGSGLGISIAQNLTELQNGEFRLKLDGDLFKVELEWEM